MPEIKEYSFKDTKIINTIYECEKDIVFEIKISDDNFLQEFLISICFNEDKESAEKYLTRITIGNRYIGNNSANVNVDFYEELDALIFNELDKLLPTFTDDEKVIDLGDLCVEILNKIQEVIEDEIIVVD